jgi:hypothetical protein
MKALAVLAALTGALLLSSPLWADGMSELDATPAPQVMCNANTAAQECCSAKNCNGKRLSQRDRHNCKVTSKGKSWHANGGACFNI